MVPKKIPFKNIYILETNFKKIQHTRSCFLFDHSSYLGGTSTWQVLNSAFAICLRKKADTSHFYSLQLQTKQKKLHHTCIQFEEPYTNILRYRYQEGPVDLFKFTKEVLKEDIKKLVPKDHIFKRFWLWFWDVSLLLFNSFSRQVVLKHHIHSSKPVTFSCRFV